MIQTRFGTCGRAKTVPIPRAATACEINEANLDATPKHIGVPEMFGKVTAYFLGPLPNPMEPSAAT
jgi:hypothetical protein